MLLQVTVTVIKRWEVNLYIRLLGVMALKGDVDVVVAVGGGGGGV